MCADHANLRTERLRVLLVPDLVYWITGTIARQIVRHNPWLDATICSGRVLRQHVHEFGKMPAPVDLVHFLTPLEAQAWLPMLQGRMPWVSTVHHVDQDATVQLAKQADAVMTVSPQWSRHLLEHGLPEAQLAMIPNGVDTEVFRPAVDCERSRLRRRFGLPADALVVGFFGKRTSDYGGRKGIDVFIRAATALQRQLPDVATLIVGPGWRDLVGEQRRAGLNCKWFPFLLEHEQLAEIYRALDVYWVTARIEGGPVPLLEAMASGICAVTTPVGIAPEVVDDGHNALLGRIDDSDSFVQHTLELACSPERRRQIGLAARATIVDRYQWRRTVQNVRSLYGSALNNFASRHASVAAPTFDLTESFSPAVVNPRFQLTEYADNVPGPTRKWLSAREHLAMAQELAKVGQRSAAARVAARALRDRPADRSVVKGVAEVLGLGPAIQAAALGRDLIRWLESKVVRSRPEHAG